MKEKLKTLFQNITYNFCYSNKEYESEAVFLMCKGETNSRRCNQCPYYIDINEKRSWLDG